MGHSENMVAVWFNLKTGKEIHRSIVGKYVWAGFHEMDIDEPEAKKCRRRGPKWPLLDFISRNARSKGIDMRFVHSRILPDNSHRK